MNRELDKREFRVTYPSLFRKSLPEDWLTYNPYTEYLREKEALNELTERGLTDTQCRERLELY
ncbi:hypothetical protein [Sporosarcina ureae]|uniref:hypothetical protein n=1 Tax=Sporosarcina ureae TaxID=1571 RepID=UPI0009DC7C91|nr:hypothetical protein [Sporosarcina ureae]ARF16396.1 hypothetical protein SporoP17a_03170 [Sporosarcina ureae]